MRGAGGRSSSHSWAPSLNRLQTTEAESGAGHAGTACRAPGCSRPSDVKTNASYRLDWPAHCSVTHSVTTRTTQSTLPRHGAFPSVVPVPLTKAQRRRTGFVVSISTQRGVSKKTATRSKPRRRRRLTAVSLPIRARPSPKTATKSPNFARVTHRGRQNVQPLLRHQAKSCFFIKNKAKSSSSDSPPRARPCAFLLKIPHQE